MSVGNDNEGRKRRAEVTIALEVVEIGTLHRAVHTLPGSALGASSTGWVLPAECPLSGYLTTAKESYALATILARFNEQRIANAGTLPASA